MKPDNATHYALLIIDPLPANPETPGANREAPLDELRYIQTEVLALKTDSSLIQRIQATVWQYSLPDGLTYLAKTLQLLQKTHLAYRVAFLNEKIKFSS